MSGPVRRVVIDTSVWISGVFFRKGNPARVLDAWRDGLFEVIYSEPIFAEVKSRLEAKAVEFEADSLAVALWLDIIQSYGVLASSSGEIIRVSRDPEDDKFLDAAISGSADLIVSSDKDLQILNEFQGVKIVSPRAFLEIIGVPATEGRAGQEP